jgi:hypothetical protein
MFLPTVAYILSNFAPNYVVANRKHNSGGVFGKIIAFIMGAAASAVAVDYYTEKTWSDGSKTTEYDTGMFFMCSKKLKFSPGFSRAFLYVGHTLLLAR